MKMNLISVNLLRTFAACLFVAALACNSGCGGGTSGTGTGERSFEGRILTTAGAPIKGATVTILDTGEYTFTDNSGEFAILSDVQGTEIELMIEAQAVSTTVEVQALDESNIAVRVDVVVDPQSPSTAVNISKLQVKAQIVGACDPFFENRRTIRQSGRIADGAECSAQVQIYGDGMLLERIPFVIQHSGCEGKQWFPVSEGETGFGVHAGVGTANFTFFNKPEFCLYRIVAPYQVAGLESVSYRIDTFLRQAAESK